MNSKCFRLIFCLIASSIFALPAFSVVYVDQNAPGPAHDGTSWDTAFLTIQEGVNAATPGGEVWVADGVYVENVVMAAGAQLYGGFLGAEPGGYETSLDQRDYVNNIATIDGNQSGSCVVMADGSGVDGFTITNGSGTLLGNHRRGGGVCCNDLGATAWIENNTITGNEVGGYLGLGGGIYCANSSAVITNNTVALNSAAYGGGMLCSMASPAITSNTIALNSARSGGGLYCADSSPTITTNTIASNSVDFMGGGLYLIGEGSPAIANNTITGNLAALEGGGVYCLSCSPTLTGNMVSGNSARAGGGLYTCELSSPVLSGEVIRGNHALYGGGLVCIWSPAWITNCLIEGNSAEAEGGGIVCAGSPSPTIACDLILANSAGSAGGGISCWDASSPVVRNSDIIRNTAATTGGGLQCSDYARPSLTANTITDNSAVCGRALACDSYNQWSPSEVTMADCILWNGGDEVCNNDNSTITITYSDVWGGWPGEGNIDLDPLFVDPESGNWHLSFGSPCIDAGTNDAPGLPEKDWEGEPRVYDGDGDEEEYGVYATVDMGADEFVPFVATAPDPQPESDGPLFGTSQAGLPAWVWFSIPIDPDSCCNGDDCYNPATVLGFPVSSHLWRWDKYAKTAEVYKTGFVEWDLAVGDSYLLFLWTDVPNPSYLGISPFTPRTFEHKLGRQGWTWIGIPGLTELGGQDFMSSVKVKYPSDETGCYRTSQQDHQAIPDNWIAWGWPYWNTWRKCMEVFTPYAPFGHRTCYPWLGYRVWVKVGTAQSEDDADQVTLIWPKSQ